MMKKLWICLLLSFVTFSASAQFSPRDFETDDDLELGGDIFSDFNEDLEAAQVMEDERFYRHSRFVSVNIGLGATRFTGNRGKAYKNNDPSFGLSIMYFIDFHNVFVMGFEYSQHTMYIDTFVNGYRNTLINYVETSLLRPYFGMRRYLDTSDLGTALTYSNPYFTGRVEYWYQTNRFGEESVNQESGGSIGTAVGFGLEFPIEIKRSYFNVEFLYHMTNFFDRATTDYIQIPAGTPNHDFNQFPSKYGYDDLTGSVYSIFFNYVISW